MFGFERCHDCGELIAPWKLRGTLFEKNGKTSVFHWGGKVPKYPVCYQCYLGRSLEENNRWKARAKALERGIFELEVQCFLCATRCIDGAPKTCTKWQFDEAQFAEGGEDE